MGPVFGYVDGDDCNIRTSPQPARVWSTMMQEREGGSGEVNRAITFVIITFNYRW